MKQLYDEPITSSEDDAYGRATSVQHCADLLSAIDSESAFVIGLSGAWGSGKTSYINLLKEELGNREDAPKVVDFNPWIYTSQDQLLSDFFTTLRKGLDLGKDSELGGLISEYAGAISTGAIATLSETGIQQLAALSKSPLLGAIVNIAIVKALKKAGKAISTQDKTLSDIRDEISTSLARQNNNVVVVIDDLDRLSTEEILLVFKLVNLTASFPHVTFLLAYDFKVVVTALSEVQGINGAEYLEKIVHLPIELPPASREALREQIAGVLNEYLEEVDCFEIDQAERTRLYRVFDRFVMQVVSTPRRAKRYINKVTELWFALKDEICPVDLIGFAAIELFIPNVISWLWMNREDICGRTYHSNQDSEWVVNLSTELRRRIEGAMADPLLASAAYDAMQCMFPVLPSNTNAQFANPPRVQQGTGRVAHIKNLEVLFGALSTDGLGRRELLDLIDSSDESAVVKGLCELDSLGDVGRFFELVEIRQRQLGKERPVVLSRAILVALKFLKVSPPPGMLSFSSAQKASSMLATLLSAMGLEEASQLMVDVAEHMDAASLTALSWFLFEEIRAQKTGDSRPVCLTSQAFGRIVELYRSAILDTWPQTLTENAHSATYVCRLLDEEFGTGIVAELRRRYAESMRTRVMYAAFMLPIWHGTEGSGYGFADEPRNETEYILPLPTKEEVESFTASDEFESLSEGVRIGVGAYYLLLDFIRDPAREGAKRKVSESEALTQLMLWEAKRHGSESGE